MIQIALVLILVVAGLTAIFKGRVQVTASRTLEANGARVVGVGLLLSAGLSFASVEHGLLMMVGGALVCTIVGYAIAHEDPLAKEIPT